MACSNNDMQHLLNSTAKIKENLGLLQSDYRNGMDDLRKEFCDEIKDLQDLFQYDMKAFEDELHDKIQNLNREVEVLTQTISLEIAKIPKQQIKPFQLVKEEASCEKSKVQTIQERLDKEAAAVNEKLNNSMEAHFPQYLHTQICGLDPFQPDYAKKILAFATLLS